ncbi:MAG: hypothetical protein R3C60_05085 [Parvularculaceae bacterium]
MKRIQITGSALAALFMLAACSGAGEGASEEKRMLVPFDDWRGGHELYVLAGAGARLPWR